MRVINGRMRTRIAIVTQKYAMTGWNVALDGSIRDASGNQPGPGSWAVGRVLANMGVMARLDLNTLVVSEDR
jgi:hypothetical protein